MTLSDPRWDQLKPTPALVQDMSGKVSLTAVGNSTDAIKEVLRFLQKSHRDGGALFASFRIGEFDVFDWFDSRSRLAEYSVLVTLLRTDEVQRELPALLLSKQHWGRISECSIVLTDGFTMESPFLLDGRIAQALYAGGAYGQSELDARSAKQLATAFCEELFEQRYLEIVLFSNLSAWTPWFRGIAWNWTAFLFDRRKRTFASPIVESFLWIAVPCRTDERKKRREWKSLEDCSGCQHMCST
jgi:hypothetical protein